jgi:hypothetical protein
VELHWKRDHHFPARAVVRPENLYGRQLALKTENNRAVLKEGEIGEDGSSSYCQIRSYGSDRKRCFL